MSEGLGLATIETVFDCRKNVPTKRWILALPGAGCAWYKDTGGCTMCGFNTSTYAYTLGGKLLPAFAFNTLVKLGWRSARKHQPEILAVFNGGSFFNEKEVPLVAQQKIYDFVGESTCIETLFVESRCDFITAERIREARKALGSKGLTVAIGFESQDDFIRNKVIKKGLSKTMFEKTVRTINACGAKSYAYVFLKPSGLSEHQAVSETIKTVRYCFDVGVSEVNISCAFVQENTPLHKLYLKGEFRPPWLWSIIEVLKATHTLGYVNVGGFNDEPPPIAKPSNCPRCSPVVERTIDGYRKHHNLSIFDGLQCECQAEWLATMSA